MKIQLLNDTYIRNSPAIDPDNILGVARKDEYHFVEERAVEGHSFRAVSRWYRDDKGRYLWSGATKVLVEGEWAYDPFRMNALIQRWDIPEQFWRKERRGEGVNIAILSTGIDRWHPDLSPNIKGAYNFCIPSDSNNVMDQDGEGTQVAGLIAGSGAHLVYGLAPRANLLIGKIAESSTDYQVSRLVDALYWVLDFPVNLIYIGCSLNPENLDTLEIAALEKTLQQLAKKGCLVLAPTVFASSLPASLKNCLAVVEQDNLPNSEPKILQGCAAPGNHLFTTGLHSNSTTAFSGPKAAAAATCGLLALQGQAMRNKEPDFPFAKMWEMAREAYLTGENSSAYPLAEKLFLLNTQMEDDE